MTEVPNPYAAPPAPEELPLDGLSGEPWVVRTALRETKAELEAARVDLRDGQMARWAGPLGTAFLLFLAFGTALFIEPWDSRWWDWEVRTLVDFIGEWAWPAATGAGAAVWTYRGYRTLAERRDRVARLKAHVEDLEARDRELTPPAQEESTEARALPS